MATEELVSVGKAVATHGVKGRVKVVPYGTTLAALSPGGRILVKDKDGVRAMTLEHVSAEGQRLIIGLKGVNTPEEAKRTIIGREVALKKEDLPPANTLEGEFYVYQLLGLEVQTTRGRRVGKVVGVLETGAHDIYVTKDEENEYLIPAHEEVIVKVDLLGGRIVVEDIEGLFET